ncbi:MAG: hypothetical protein WCT14_18520 [Treponemataceae bacterium]
MISRLFFALGVLLGVVEPQAAPDFAAKIFRTDDAIYFNAELSGAYSQTALELALRGNRVAFRVLAELEGATPSKTQITRSIRFDLSSKTWNVESHNGLEAKTVKNSQTASEIASRIWGIRLGPIEHAANGATITIVAQSGLLDDEGAWHPAGILWGYAEPKRTFVFRSATEIPY